MPWPRSCIALLTFSLVTPFLIGQNAASTEEGSLADIARALKAKKKVDVVVNEEDGKQLFKDVDTILTFASQRSQLARRSSVKYKLVGRETVDRYFADAFAESEEARKIQKSELVLKKFGLLPADFQLQKFAVEQGGNGLAGFYDFRDKTMYLLNWIDLPKQRPVMAHELTHALQDQNYNLKAWKTVSRQSGGRVVADDTAESEARVAVIEGQAMIVFFDYTLQPTGTTLADAGHNLEALKTRLLSVYDSPVSFKTAPLIFKELTTFPYIDGFAFELEVLRRSGTQAAFAGVFARPPRNSHDIMHPEDYLSGARSTPMYFPNLAPVLGENRPVYDSGPIGELDVRTMSKQFGRENDAYSVAPFWDGGAYVAVRKPLAVGKPEAELAHSDLALIYVSRWKNSTAAKRFADIYRSALVKRSRGIESGSETPSLCEGQPCKVTYSARFDSEDGPVVIELSRDNTLVISQGIDFDLLDRVKQAFKNSPRSKPVESSDLILRFSSLPAVQAMRERFVQELTALPPR